MAFTTEDYGTRIDRKLCAHYINCSQTIVWERIGKDLEELSFDMNAAVEDSQNILGENNTVVSGYSPSASVNPYYAREGTALFEFLQDIIMNRKTGSDLEVDYLEVHIWDEGTTTGTYVAYKETAVLVPTSMGGNTAGYQIPFEIHLQGDVTKGLFTASTKTFVADE